MTRTNTIRNARKLTIWLPVGDCPSPTFSLLAKVFAKGKMFWYIAVKASTPSVPKLLNVLYEVEKQPTLKQHISKTNGGTGLKFRCLAVFDFDCDDGKFVSCPVILRSEASKLENFQLSGNRSIIFGQREYLTRIEIAFR